MFSLLGSALGLFLRTREEETLYLVFGSCIWFVFGSCTRDNTFTLRGSFRRHAKVCLDDIVEDTLKEKACWVFLPHEGFPRIKSCVSCASVSTGDLVYASVIEDIVKMH